MYVTHAILQPLGQQTSFQYRDIDDSTRDMTNHLASFHRHARETELIKFAEYFTNNRGFRFSHTTLIPNRAIESAYPRTYAWSPARNLKLLIHDVFNQTERCNLAIVVKRVHLQNLSTWIYRPWSYRKIIDIYINTTGTSCLQIDIASH